MGVPRLACLRPAAWLNQWPSTTRLHQPNTQDPHEGFLPFSLWRTPDRCHGCCDKMPRQEGRRRSGWREDEDEQGGSAPSFIAGEGQPAIPTITGNDDISLHAAGTRQVGQLSRQHGEAETPMSNQSPRINQGCRLLGPTVLRTCPLASPRSQVRARLGPGGYCRRSGNGGP